jgi:hypothetical protein
LIHALLITAAMSSFSYGIGVGSEYALHWHEMSVWVVITMVFGLGRSVCFTVEFDFMNMNTKDDF